MHALTRTARMTGLFYLGNAIIGVLGFLIVRPQLFAADDPNATLANLVTHESLARAGVALELGMVVTVGHGGRGIGRPGRRRGVRRQALEETPPTVHTPTSVAS